MKYIAPAIQIEEAQAVNMLAESMSVFKEPTVDGQNALTKEDNGWDIWGEE